MELFPKRRVFGYSPAPKRIRTEPTVVFLGTFIAGNPKNTRLILGISS
jgi:hypothetical protein